LRRRRLDKREKKIQTNIAKEGWFHTNRRKRRITPDNGDEG